MKNLIVNVCPTFQCNNNCDYCYLGDCRRDKTVLKIADLLTRISQLQGRGYVLQFELFGGDFNYLDFSYLETLLTVLSLYTKEPIHITTNYIEKHKLDLFRKYNATIGVSINPNRRDYVQNIKWMMDNPDLEPMYVFFPFDDLSLYYEKVGKKLNLIQYYHTFNSLYVVDNTSMYLAHYESNFDKYNNFILDSCLEGNWSPYMDTHIFINPYGQFGSTSYMSDCTETFLWYDNIEAYEAMCIGEKLVYGKDKYNIPVEHLRPEDHRPYQDLLEAYKEWKK